MTEPASWGGREGRREGRKEGRRRGREVVTERGEEEMHLTLVTLRMQNKTKERRDFCEGIDTNMTGNISVLKNLLLSNIIV